MKTLIPILIGTAMIALGIYLFPNIDITVTQPEVQAEGTLPGNITKFTDGTNTCYIYENVWFKVGGISCITR